MKKLTYLLMLLLSTVAISCSSDDEPGDNEFVYNGETILNNAIAKLYKADGEPAYTATNTIDIYVASASSYDVSYKYICNLLGNPNWDGKDVTVKLGKNGQDGTLKIVGQSDSQLQQGIYNKIIVNVNGYTPYTLEIITEQQAENGHSGGGVVKL